MITISRAAQWNLQCLRPNPNPFPMPVASPTPLIRRPDDGRVASAGALVARQQALVHALSGGLAASAVRATLLPLDACKTRLQLAGASANRGLRSIILANGGVLGLYRGAIPALGGVLPAAALYMGLYTTLRRTLSNRLPNRARSAAVAASAGTANMASTIFRVPLERLKQQLQAGLYPNVRVAAVATLRSKNAFQALYAGLAAQLYRDIPYTISSYVVYEKLRRSGGSPAENFAAGAVSGAVAAFVSNPFDVVKTRLMTVRANAVPAARNRGVWSTLSTVVKEDGVLALYRGLTPRIGAKMLQGALFFACYEVLHQQMSKMLAKKSTSTPV